MMIGVDILVHQKIIPLVLVVTDFSSNTTSRSKFFSHSGKDQILYRCSGSPEDLFYRLWSSFDFIQHHQQVKLIQ